MHRISGVSFASLGFGLGLRVLGRGLEWCGLVCWLGAVWRLVGEGGSSGRGGGLDGGGGGAMVATVFSYILVLICRNIKKEDTCGMLSLGTELKSCESEFAEDF